MADTEWLPEGVDVDALRAQERVPRSTAPEAALAAP